jgi:hypothetical protein
MSHQVIGEHSSKTIEEFQSALNQDDFILLEEWQPQPDGRLNHEGKMLVNHQMVGKVRVYRQK